MTPSKLQVPLSLISEKGYTLVIPFIFTTYLYLSDTTYIFCVFPPLFFPVEKVSQKPRCDFAKDECLGF